MRGRRSDTYVQREYIRLERLCRCYTSAKNWRSKWYKVIQRTLRNALLSALSFRIGDVILDRLGDEKYLFTFYDDVVIELINEKSLENLVDLKRKEDGVSCTQLNII